MAISFNTIPSSLRSPLFYAEIDNSQAGSFSTNYQALIIGQTLNTDTNTAVLVSSVAQAKTLFGAGSQLVQMVESYFKNNSASTLYVLPLADPSSGIAATGTFTLAGTATAAGTLSLYVYNTLIPIGVSSGDSAASVATAAAAAINTNRDLPVTAAAEETVVTLTAKHKGVIGNDIVIGVNFGGEANGEATPAGLAVTVTDFNAGSGAPDLTTALASLGDVSYDFIALGFNTSTALAAIAEYLNDTTGAWSYAKQLYGHAFAAFRGTVAECQTLGASLNNQHLSIMGVYGTHSSVWSLAAALMGTAAASLAIDPARPLQTLPLLGIDPPASGDRFTQLERETLLHHGISTFVVSGGTVTISRVITTYQTNAYGVMDASYLSVETLYTSSYILRYLRSAITSKYGRHKLANDGTRFGEGQAIVTPKIIKAELINAYLTLEDQGLVDDAEAFKTSLVVERSANDPNRIDVLFTPNYVNQLNVFALVNQFRL